MTLTGEYEPSPQKWVRDQVARYEATDGREANTLRDTGLPVVLFTTRGKKSGKLRKMRADAGRARRRVRDGGLARAARPSTPSWYFNLKADPEALMVQDGADLFDATARELEGEEREIWWNRAVAAYPNYAVYQTRTDRLIPVLLAERRS